MTQAFDASMIGGEPNEPVVVDKRGTLMIERESYERVIDGLKMAADGAHHLTVARQEGGWKLLSAAFDKLRAGVAKLGGLPTQAQDAVASTTLGTSKTLGIHAAYDRVYKGLDMSAKGARQIATCHRGDLRWSVYARQIETLRDRCSQLIRMRNSKRAGTLILPAGYAH